MRRTPLFWPLLAWLLLGLWLAGASAPAAAERAELVNLALRRADGALVVDYHTRLQLGAEVEDALQRGVPIYFTAEARLLRSRWYWRDERVARIARSWRLSYQPLTASWRVSLGGLSRVHGSLPEALAPMLRVAGWRLADLATLESGSRYSVEFSFRLDTEQLPRPMQIDLDGDWQIGVERTLKLD